jgi:crotonobetainyl-CoA:carnitine CoA-transferase CaiB-like acyl-CoA transferase
MTVRKRERERETAPGAHDAGDPGDLPWGDRTTHAGPLAGLRVIDAGTMIAGPFTSTLLADYGADVIKIEKPVVGDSMRQWTPMKDGRSLWWKVNARNKRLMTLDLSQPAGQAVFLRMARHADVIVENFRPGTFERWGLGYDALSEINPGVILVRVSGYGQTGPYRRRPGYGTVADAISGIPAFTGFADGPPTLPAFPLADSLAGCFGVIGALCALRDRERSSLGDEIDVSLYEPLMRIAESQVIAYDQLGLKKQRVGNRLEEDSPRNTYPTSDDHWIALSASSDRTFERLAQAIDQPGMASEERFATNPARIANADQLDAIVGDWIGARTAADVMATFEQHDVVAGRVYDIEDIFADPHFAARGDIVEVRDNDFGSVRMQCVVPRFNRHGCELRHAGGAIGEDNHFVLRTVLKLDEREVEQLESEGVV